MAEQIPHSPTTTKRKQRDLEEALNYLAKDDIKTAVKNNLPLRFHLDTVRDHADSFGLSPNNIHSLLLLAISPKFGQSVRNQLVYSLLPNDQVWSKSVLHLMSECNTGRLPYTFMALLFRWLILVYDYIDDADVLHSLYDVIFYFLESENIFPYSCHLLYLLTRREDVTLYRVRALLNLQQTKGTERPLLGLLSVYKVYSPHLISISIPKTTRNFFKNLDRAWSLKIKKVQQISDTGGETETTGSELTVPAHLTNKRQKKTLLPDLQPATLVSEVRLNEVDQRLSRSSEVRVPFTEIKSFRQLMDNLHRVELPSQLAAVLGNKNLQHVVLCHPDQSVSLRIEYWLEQALTEEFFLDSSDKSQGERLLYLLIQLSDFLLEGVPVVEHFLSRYLHLWDGTEFRRYILQLITRYRLRRFDVMYDLLLEPLRKLFFSSSVYFKCEVLTCFTELLSNLVLLEWPRYKYTAQKQRDAGDIANTASVYTSQHDSHSVFSEEVEYFSGLQTVIEFIQFTDSLCSLGLEAESDHCLLSHCVLSFYQLVSRLYKDYSVPIVELCGRGILYKHLFSQNAMLLSRFCDILNSYRVSFSSLRQASVTGWTEEQHAARSQQIANIAQFNGYVLDFCDCLWRNKAFSGTEPLTVFQLLNDTEALKTIKSTRKSANATFSIYCHPALLGHVISYQKELKLPDLRIHPVHLKHEREELLEYLGEQQLSGIQGFIRTFIKPRGDTNTSAKLSMMSSFTS